MRHAPPPLLPDAPRLDAFSPEKWLACSTLRASTAFPDAPPGCDAMEKFPKRGVQPQSTTLATGVAEALVVTPLKTSPSPHGILTSNCLTLLHQAGSLGSYLFLGYCTLRCPHSSPLPWSLTMACYRMLTLRHTLVLIPTVISSELSAQCIQCVLWSLGFCYPSCSAPWDSDSSGVPRMVVVGRCVSRV